MKNKFITFAEMGWFHPKGMSVRINLTYIHSNHHQKGQTAIWIWTNYACTEILLCKIDWGHPMNTTSPFLHWTSIYFAWIWQDPLHHIKLSTILPLLDLWFTYTYPSSFTPTYFTHSIDHKPVVISITCKETK